jgi:hypothetical protein
MEAMSIGDRLTAAAAPGWRPEAFACRSRAVPAHASGDLVKEFQVSLNDVVVADPLLGGHTIDHHD